ncbi:undifferentiated embryonic cell transcription factor 1 [Perognathus longimembris pacificus]|uniref:undifferentiated embryonic cell transcription factor 1 n=1 Tax=Perognathus longimembris pacificus TaxID=214514 RepID=UPI00201A146D|nr:undifferentiated embryonic cell transcription factor 1 [Perognathus longimembris pacificus]
MLLRSRRPPPLAPLSPAPPSPADSAAEPLPPAGGTPGTPPRSRAPPSSPSGGSPRSLGSPGSPVSPGSARRTPWSAWETELLLAELLQPAVWRALLLDRRQSLPTYRRVSAALAQRQVRRTPVQCRRRYKFLKNKVREDQPPGPFDAQIRELMGLLGDDSRRGRARRRPAGPGRPQRGRRSAPSASAPAPDEPDAEPPPAAAATLDADPAGAPEPSTPHAADRGRLPASPRPPTPTAYGPPGPEPGRSPGSPPLPDPAPAPEDPAPPPGLPADRSPPPAAAPSLNAALLQTLTHLGDIVAVLGPLRDQLLTLNQHVEQLRGSFDQTVSLAVGFILGSAAAERGVLGDPR